MPHLVHRYMTKTFTNPQPPGFADFLRGTIALYQYSKQYNYKMKIDINSHPVFQFLDIPEEYRVSLKNDTYTIEILPPLLYEAMPSIFNTILNDNSDDIYVMTNAFYREHSDISEEFSIIKRILTPNKQLKDYIDHIKSNIKIDFTKPYEIIHVRLGDECLINKKDIVPDKLNRVRMLIQEIKVNTQNPILLIGDSKHLKDNVSDLCETTQTVPIHTGLLDNELVNERVLMTLGEFFLLSMSNKIHCINIWNDGSGFSRISSKIYSIEYVCYQV